MKKAAAKIQSDFAILDVKRGRVALSKWTKGHRIPVTITGYITEQWGRDDGVSIEFTVDVASATLGKPEDKP